MTAQALEFAHPYPVAQGGDMVWRKTPSPSFSETNHLTGGAELSFEMIQGLPSYNWLAKKRRVLGNK